MSLDKKLSRYLVWPVVILLGCFLAQLQVQAGNELSGYSVSPAGKITVTSEAVFIQWDSTSATVAAVGTTTMPSLSPHATSGVPLISMSHTVDEAFGLWGTMPLSYQSADNVTITVHAIYGGNVGADDSILRCQFSRLGENGDDMDSALVLSGGGYLTLTGNATGGKNFTGAWTLAAADMDFVTAGERFFMVIDRIATRTDDDAAGDLRIHGIVLSQ